MAIVSEELACKRENISNAQGTTTSKSHAILFHKPQTLEGKILANQNVIH